MAAADGTAGFREFARVLGCKPGYVTQLRHAGRLVLTDDGKRVRVAESLRRIEATRDPSKAGVAARHAAERAAKAEAAPAPVQAPPAAPDSAPDGWPVPVGSHADRRAKALADKEEQLAEKARRENLVEMGRLLPADEVEAALLDAGTTLRTSLENLPDTLAPELAAAKDEARVRVILGEAIEHVLGEIARHFNTIAKREGEGA